MDADKMLKLQMQVRQNNDEMMSYIGDLNSWEVDMKKKDAELKMDKFDKNPMSLPPVRNSLRKKKKKSKSQENVQLDKTKRIRAYDYREWDKFDVDKACEDVDEKRQCTSSECETDEEWEASHRSQQANNLKEEGNQYFKEGKYTEAIECYSRGIDLDSGNALLMANRAMALLKQDKYAAAECDCSVAISLDPTYTKAFLRRGAARVAMKKYCEAEEDFQQVLKAEPTNRQAKSELDSIHQLLNQPLELKASLDHSDLGIVKPIYKPPAERSKKPLTRVCIEEVGVEEFEETKRFREKLKSSTTASTCIITDNFNKFLDKKTDQNNYNACGDHQKNAKDKSCHLDFENLSSFSRIKELERSENCETMTKALNSYQDKIIDCKIIKQYVAAPVNSFQFQADWKILKNKDLEFYHYLKQIDPSNYRHVFGEALDSDILHKIIVVLQNYYISNKLDVLPVLQQLTLVNRFSMNIMFLSTADKQALIELFSYILVEGQYSKEMIDGLKKIYELLS